MNKICHCNNKALLYTDVSNGIYIYKCNTNDKILKGKSLLDLVPNPTRPCDYYEEVPYCNELLYSSPFTKEKPTIKENNAWTNLYKKINYFLEKKYYITFQEIEIDCNTLNIPTYNHTKESMYEFCLRIQKLCLSKQSNVL